MFNKKKFKCSVFSKNTLENLDFHKILTNIYILKLKQFYFGIIILYFEISNLI